MFLRILFISLMMSVLFFNTPLASENDPILAKTRNFVFRQSDFDRLMSYSPPNLQEQLKRNPQQSIMLIKKIMHQKIVADLARKEGLDKKTEIKEQLQYLIDSFLTKEYIFFNVVEKISVTEDELKDYYNHNKEKFTTPEQIKVSHILVKVNFGASGEEKKKARDKAKQILEWLKKGEKFETLAEQYSDDQQSKKIGGSLGYIERGRMPKSFDDTAFSMKPGQISDVVETDYGYHIIQVVDHRDAVTKSFDEVKGFIKKELTNELAILKVEEFTKKTDKDAGLEIYTETIVDKGKK